MATDSAKPAAPSSTTPTDDPIAPSTPGPHARLEKWLWILIYVGISVAALGWYTGRTDTALGWLIGVPGALAVATGIALIYVRSRLD
ncbi:hypothetical protein NF681_11010 [Comamonadaceae bacterium OTU4NAUVB1]|jgi:hypothetical protein|nr:hypothetical protein NF681_11010 [Comamonadaceae bacterium OTU4NAUVB1]HSU20342.1 hypothetical protein [Variovorax sp.]